MIFLIALPSLACVGQITNTSRSSMQYSHHKKAVGRLGVVEVRLVNGDHEIVERLSEVGGVRREELDISLTLL
mgnify:CR=1 FL=1